MSLSLKELEYAACDVIQIIKQIPELSHTRLSVIGGLALWHYLPDYRPTDNINFITNISTSPSAVKKKLLERPCARFVQRSQVLFYISPSGREIQVDISPEWLSPYLPASARNIRDIPYGEVPYISLSDLIVFKLDSSGLRSNPLKRDRDACDAAALVEHETLERRRLPQLSGKQVQVVEEALCDVVKCGTKEKSWWEARLGLTPSASAKTGERLDDGDDDDNDDDERDKSFCRNSSSRPHANSDSAYAGGAVADDPSAVWHYERLDRAHTPMHSRRSNSVRYHHHHGSSAPRPGVARSSSYTGRSERYHQAGRLPPATMTQPKTTHASYYGYNNGSSSSSSSSNETATTATTTATPTPTKRSRGASCTSAYSDSGYASSDCGGGDGGYYYLEPAGSSSEMGYEEGEHFDARPTGRLGTVHEQVQVHAHAHPKVKPGVVKRSVTFQL